MNFTYYELYYKQETINENDRVRSFICNGGPETNFY